MKAETATHRIRYRMFKTYTAALVVLCVGGILPALCSTGIYEDQQKTGLQPPLPSPDRSDALSQQLAFFSLGGLRSLVAEIYTLDATDAWSNRDWVRLRRRWESATTLMPRRVNYWIHAENDMTANAAGDYIRNRKLSETLKKEKVKEYINSGENFLLEGIANNPGSWKLHIALAEHYSNLHRKPQFEKAVDAYQKAMELGAPEHYNRPLFYNLCRIPGREQEAWQQGRALFEYEEHHVPAVQFLLFALQNKIQVPADEALSIDRLFRDTPQQTEKEVLTTAYQIIENFSDNDLLYPTYGANAFLDEYAHIVEE